MEDISLGALVALQAVASWAVGDTSLQELWSQVPQILAGLGLITLRAGVKTDAKLKTSNKKIFAALGIFKGAVGWFSGLVSKASTWFTALLIYWGAKKKIQGDQMKAELEGLKNVKAIREKLRSDPDFARRVRNKYTRPSP